MIVTNQGSSKVELMPVPPLPDGVIDLSANVPVDSWMANPDTNLLRAHRMKGILTVVGALVLLAVLGIGIFVFLQSSDDSKDDDRVVTPVPVDAAVPRVVPVDANTNMSKDDILAISRFGYLTIKSNVKTTIYVDGKYIGETPMTRLPLPPGPKKIKAVGPKNKTKLINTTILGGQDTDEGTLIW
jgi:hypothetical protein